MPKKSIKKNYNKNKNVNKKILRLILTQQEEKQLQHIHLFQDMRNQL